MPAYFYALERDTTHDGANHCWHCKSDATFSAYKVSGATATGRLFLSLSPAVPLLVCGKCGKASQKLTTAGKLMVGLSWLPMTLLLGFGAVYAIQKAAVDPDLRDAAMVLVGLTALAACVAGFMMWRIFRMPLYPTVGKPIEVDGKTFLGRG